MERELSAKDVESLAEMAWGADALNNQGESTFGEVPKFRQINYRRMVINVAVKLGFIIKRDEALKVELGNSVWPVRDKWNNLS